jgi:hypothetical protein
MRFLGSFGCRIVVCASILVVKAVSLLARTASRGDLTLPVPLVWLAPYGEG